MLQGYSIIDGKPRHSSGPEFAGFETATGAKLDPVYHSATAEDIDLAANLAGDASAVLSKLSGKEKARFLRHIAGGDCCSREQGNGVA
jgi:NADP-dependent aldehyde dehydrogenase